MGYNAFLVIAVLSFVGLLWDLKEKYFERKKPNGDEELKKSLVKLAIAVIAFVIWVIKRVI